jgi:hypothetical protein
MRGSWPTNPAVCTGRSFNGRTRGSGPRYRGSNPCLPATSLPTCRNSLTGDWTPRAANRHPAHDRRGALGVRTARRKTQPPQSAEPYKPTCLCSARSAVLGSRTSNAARWSFRTQTGRRRATRARVGFQGRSDGATVVSTSAPPRCLDGGDVDLLHRHHRLEGTLCLTATSRKRLG